MLNRHPLIAPSTVIGRDRAAAIRLDSPSVSRRHAIVVRQDERWWIIDQKSVNGLRVNGQRVERHALVDGDLVEFGDPGARLTYRDGAMWSSANEVMAPADLGHAASGWSPGIITVTAGAFLILLLLNVSRRPPQGDVGVADTIPLLEATRMSPQWILATDTQPSINTGKGVSTPATPISSSIPHRMATAPSPAVASPSAIAATILYSADRTQIAIGECVTVSWEVAGIRTVHFNGRPVTGSGSSKECPESTTRYTLSIVLADGTEQKRSIKIVVIPQEATPTQPVIPTTIGTAVAPAPSLTPTTALTPTELMPTSAATATRPRRGPQPTNEITPSP